MDDLDGFVSQPEGNLETRSVHQESDEEVMPATLELAQSVRPFELFVPGRFRRADLENRRRQSRTAMTAMQTALDDEERNRGRLEDKPFKESQRVAGRGLKRATTPTVDGGMEDEPPEKRGWPRTAKERTAEIWEALRELGERSERPGLKRYKTESSPAL